MTSKVNKEYRYVYFFSKDGIGNQFKHISQLLNYVSEVNCKLIVDFRNMALFSDFGDNFEESELNKVLLFDTDRIIYKPLEIDEIARTNTDEIVTTSFFKKALKSKNLPFPFISGKDLLSTITTKGMSACCLKGKLKLVGEYKKTFDKYREAVSTCVGVHARLGNGEQKKLRIRGLRWKFGWDRMKISPETFFSAMNEHKSENMFVCTDTPSFFNKCLEMYGERIIYLDRFMPPENCGPGHNQYSISKKSNKKRREYLMKRREIGSYRLLGEAIIEMFLLGECKKLICNKSDFTHYARSCCKVDSHLLKR